MYKTIENYNNYEINEKGEIRNKLTLNKLKPGNNGNGYLFVNLSLNGKVKSFYVHRLVGLHFLNQSDKTEINHKDGNKSNNDFNNLEWVTSSENKKHAFKNKLNHTVKGEKNHNSKLTNWDIKFIKAWLKQGFSQRKIAKAFKVHNSIIHGIAHNKRWSHVI